jgi:two-component system NtrC family sensor kinase
VNHEPHRSDLAAVVSSPDAWPVASQETLSPGEPEESFQKLLLHIASKAAEHSDLQDLIRLSCQASREFFQVSGVYFWRCQSADVLIGEQADGKMAESFAGMQMRPEDSAVAAQAVRQRRTLFVNHLDSADFSVAQAFAAKSILAAPLVVRNDVLGAMTFLHDSDDDFFNEDLAAKATTLAGQLGSLIEAARLGRASQEEYRRAEILADVASVWHGTPDLTSVVETLADRLRLLLRTRLVCVLLRREGPFELKAVSAETPHLATSARAHHDRHTLRFAADLAQRAIAAGEPISVSISGDAHSFGGLVCPGMLIAAPFRTSRTQGAILLYPREDGPFTAEERTLVAAVAGFGAVAVSHAELHAAAEAQARELHQLMEISSELNASPDLDHFLQTFVVQVAAFLGFARCFVALLEDDQFHIRCAVENGELQRLDRSLPEGVVSRALRKGEVFCTDEARQVPGINLEAVVQHEVRELLAVPLCGSGGRPIGMFGVLDRRDGTGVSQEDVRRARALSHQVAVMLEIARNLDDSEQHRRRGEITMALAREIDGDLRLPEFARRFVHRTAELTGSTAGFLAVRHQDRWQVAALLQPERSPEPAPQPVAVFADAEPAALSSPTAAADPEPDFSPIFDATLDNFLAHHPDCVIAAPADLALGLENSSSLGWTNCILVRLRSSNGELAGLLCLSRASAALTHQDRAFLESVASHAAMILDNACLFTRMERANRHWIETFDAVADFIVVHDQSDKVLRVNRSLADMIGVPVTELIGLNMRSLPALTGESASHSCPFCRSMTEDGGEFVHPVLDRTYLVSASRVHGASGVGWQTIHVMKDITDRREAEQRYRELFDNIQEGLFFATPDGRFIEVNDAMVTLLGYDSREELLQIDTPAQLYFSLEQRERHARTVQEQGHLRNFEMTLRRKDGLPVHVLVNAFGHNDDQGRLLQIRGLMLDVTGLRASRSELQRERDFSSKILSNTQSLILVADTAGLISYGNRRWHDAGFERQELIGRPLVELAAPAFVNTLSGALQDTLHGEQVDNLELEIVRRNGSVGKFSANLSPMRDEQGSVTSIVVVLTDITDAAVLRDKLVHAEKMAAVGQLVSGVAHEVNNPLTAILGFADLLMDDPDLPEGVRKDLRVILQEAQRTKQIVQNLLSFARQMPPQRHPLQLNTILRRTMQLRSYDFHSHGVEVIEHFDEGLPDVIGDAHQLQQVFLNILNNAYDAVHEVGRPARIEIMSTKSGDAVEVSFCDNGNGISQPDKIFDPFFTTKEVGKGTGLGLSICYGIVKEHGGEILYHNNITGEGATFIVRLPAASHTAVGVAAGVNPS